MKMAPKTKGAKGGKGKAKSKSILSFFTPSFAASTASTAHATTPPARSAPAATAQSPSHRVPPSPRSKHDASDLVDLTDDGRNNNPGTGERGAIEGGGLDPSDSRGSPGSSGVCSRNPLFGGASYSTADPETKGGVGFVRASSLAGAGTAPSGRSKACRTETGGTHEPPPFNAASGASATASVGKRPLGSVSVTSSTSSWGSLGRGRGSVGGGGGGGSAAAGGRTPGARRTDGGKIIKLPLHVVGLQFRERFTEPSPGQGEGQHPAARGTPPPNTIANINGDPVLELEREPYNAHDRNAIKVLVAPPPSQQQLPRLPSRFLGYIPGRIAVLLAPLMDGSPGTAVAQVTLKTVPEEEEEGAAVGSGPRNTLPALLEVQPLGGASREPFSGLIAKVSTCRRCSSCRRV